MAAVCRSALFLLVLVAASGRAHALDFRYVEPGLASCPAAPAAGAAAPKTVAPGVALPGSIRVACGFDQGSYTVSLNSTDAGATFTPKTFLVNFGRVVGSGTFAVRFATPGAHRVWTTITSNMGSPAVRGHFTSAASEFQVVAP
jgi:hypothetical protein